MRRRHRHLRVMAIAFFARRVAVVLLAATLAACETGPSLPLLSPIEQARTYGYSETAKGPEKVEVTFVAPTQRSTRFQPERDADANAARTRATDMALWRAAQIAQQRGFAGFRVTQTRADTDVYHDDYWDDPFYGPGWGPWGPWRGRRFGWPYPYYPSASPYTWVQPRVSLDVELRNELAPGDYKAADVISELRRRYPQAEMGVVQSK
jgi:hypothetical protein